MSARARAAAFDAAIALLAAMAAGSLLMIAYGASPFAVYRVMFARTWGSTYGIGQVLFRASVLTFTGLAVAMPFRAGLFNIGAEGQLVAGSFLCAIAGAALPPGTPWIAALPIALAAAALGGAIAGAVPGVLRARFGVHEVLTTILLNFVIGAVVQWIASRHFYLTESVRTTAVVAGARLPSLGLGESAASLAVPLAAATAGACAWFLARTRRGFEWRALGKNPAAAQAGRVSITKTTIAALTVGGALAGLVGAASVLGYKGYYEKGQAAGAGFLGIAVALLARGNPLGSLLAALLFGTLAEGTLAAGGLVPKEIVDVLLAVIVLTVAIASAARPAPTVAPLDPNGETP